jgi:hypothetical protein
MPRSGWEGGPDRRVVEGGKDVFLFEERVSLKDFRMGSACTQQAEDVADADAMATDGAPRIFRVRG